MRQTSRSSALLAGRLFKDVHQSLNALATNVRPTGEFPNFQFTVLPYREFVECSRRVDMRRQRSPKTHE